MTKKEVYEEVMRRIATIPHTPDASLLENWVDAHKAKGLKLIGVYMGVEHENTDKELEDILAQAQRRKLTQMQPIKYENAGDWQKPQTVAGYPVVEASPSKKDPPAIRALNKAYRDAVRILYATLLCSLQTEGVDGKGKNDEDGCPADRFRKGLEAANLALSIALLEVSKQNVP